MPTDAAKAAPSFFTSLKNFVSLGGAPPASPSATRPTAARRSRSSSLDTSGKLGSAAGG